MFGENRVQEAKAKWPDLRAARGGDRQGDRTAPDRARCRATRRPRPSALFDVIETLDRESLARALAEAMAKLSRRPKLYVQVNTGAEPQKAGVGVADADAFIAAAREKHGLTISGLMCIPPVDEPASPHFALLALIAKRNGLAELSMGMSADWPLAVQLGATSVRLGSAIFGERG